VAKTRLPNKRAPNNCCAGAREAGVLTAPVERRAPGEQVFRRLRQYARKYI